MCGHTCVRVGLVASQQGHHHGDALLLLLASVLLALREIACETWAGPFVWHAFRHLQPHLQQTHAGIIQSAYVSKSMFRIPCERVGSLVTPLLLR